VKWEIKKSPRGTVRKSQLSLILLKKTVFARILPPSPRPIQFLTRNRDGKDPENHLDFSPLVVNAIFIKNKIHSVPSTVAPCVEIASSEKSNSFPIPVSSPEAARKRDFSPSFGGRLKLPVPFSGGD